MRLLTGLSTLCQSSPGEQFVEAVGVGDLEEEKYMDKFAMTKINCCTGWKRDKLGKEPVKIASLLI